MGFENFVVNASFEWSDKHEELQETYGCNIPWTILPNPTFARNLHCTGYWAAEYGNRLNLSYEKMDSIVCRVKELGVRFLLCPAGNLLLEKRILFAYVMPIYSWPIKRASPGMRTTCAPVLVWTTLESL